MKTKSTKIPKASLVNVYLPGHYTEAIECQFEDSKNITADDIQVSFWTDFPRWIDALFKLRNKIVKLFGLETEKPADKNKTAQYIRDGKSYGIATFPPHADNENILCLTDKHLTMYLSIMTLTDGSKKTAIASTIVKFHNTFGRIYFAAIYPFHHIIVRTMLKSTIKKLGGK